MANFSKVETSFIQLAGGLDLASAPTMIKPGFAYDTTNYEIDSVNGGYVRINGYERFDGRTSPSSVSYWTMDFTGTAPAVGATITGGTSGATGVVLYVSGSTLILGRVTGTFVVAEAIGAAVVASTASSAGVTDTALHAQYKLLAANDQRTLIGAVPGSGSVLGVWYYNGTIYAFRNNAGGTAAVMYKSTSSGWSAVTMYKEIAFTTGLVKPAEGAVLYGNTSTALGTVKRVVTRTGTWGSNAQGYIVLDVTSGTFQSGETLKLNNGAGAVQCTSASTANTITFAPSGSFEFVNYNFTGSSSNWRMYGADGKNPAFEFDGTVFCFLRTGMTTDTPTHVAAHQNCLFLSFKGSLQNSAIGDPYSYSLLTGASEIGVGDTITALLPQPGDLTTAVLHVFSTHSTHSLYGRTSADWKLVVDSPTTGASVGTAQYIGSAFVLAERGIQEISTTNRFGDFQFASTTGLIQPLINTLNQTAVASTAYKSRNQYRVFYANGSALAMTIVGNKPAGVMYIYYQHPVTCYVTTTNSSGLEVSYFGSTDGYVYQDNVGTSFDGQAISSSLMLPFSHFGSPRYRKQFRRAALDMIINGYSTVNVSYTLGSGTPDVRPGIDQTLTGESSVGYWDSMTWDTFTWDSRPVNNPVIDLCGTEKNLSLIFTSSSAVCNPHSIQGVSFNYSVRRLER